MTDVMNNIRAVALSARRNMSVEDRARASEKICSKVARSREFRAATFIACYLPTPNEVDTRTIVQRAWRAKKRIFAPISRKTGEMFFREIRPETPLISSRMGLWEPVAGDIISPRRLQLVITPTVAFDKMNHRIGMGGGYYDRCFSFLQHRIHWQKPKLIGVAFRCQKVEKISPNIWDLRLYRVVDEAS